MDFNIGTEDEVSMKSVWLVNTDSDDQIASGLKGFLGSDLLELNTLKHLCQQFDSCQSLPNVLIIDSFNYDIDLLLPEYNKYLNLLCKTKVLLITDEIDDIVLNDWMSTAEIYFYLPKPVTADNLRYNVTNIVKSAANGSAREFTIDNKKIFFDLSRLTVANEDEQQVTLTKKEFMLLNTLLEAQGSWLSKEALLKSGWPDVKVGLKTIDVHILHLRRKVQPLKIRILNKRRVGYSITWMSERGVD